MSRCPDCIFETHQLWQSGFSRVFSNCCCSCSFEPEIIKIGQSSYKMYSNNIVNFQESTTILNACTKNVWKLIECTTHVYIYIYIYIYIYVCVCVCVCVCGWVAFFHLSIVQLDHIVAFCLYNFIKIISSFLISVLVIGGWIYRNCPTRFWTFHRSLTGVICQSKNCFLFFLSFYKSKKTHI